MTWLVPPLRHLGNRVLDLLYPPYCTVCRAPAEARLHLCPECLAAAPKVCEPFCEICSTPFEGAIHSAMTCPACRDEPRVFDFAVAARRSQGVVRECIHRFKYDNHFHLRLPLARWLAETLGDRRLTGTPWKALVPVPLHPLRERERGFNQSAILAGLLAQESGLPVAALLRRTRFTRSQTRLGKVDRSENLRNAFELRQSRDVRHHHFLLIDDVLTTGTTVNACARVLKRAGAASVGVLTVARA
ncbi:MAG TPA: ComF family protein [Chthoniobacteraceae bacterium]|nr:ComF family protein [Chthoniobacteraceae bacterium]